MTKPLDQSDPSALFFTRESPSKAGAPKGGEKSTVQKVKSLFKEGKTDVTEVRFSDEHRVYESCATPEMIKNGVQMFFGGNVEAYEKALDTYGQITIDEIFRGFSNATEIEKAFLEEIKKIPQLRDNIVELLCGAHVLIEDGADRYQSWQDFFQVGKKYGEKGKRPSSHYDMGRTHTQYGFKGPFVKAILFGRCEKNGQLYTFFQFEGASFITDNLASAETHKENIKHTAQMLDYFVTRINIGPYGRSKHTDFREPLMVKPDA